ncbi:putative membrane protein [Paucibacter oligotrophus]|uniref:Putative membrane protein n=1 Tax=Roseateles oligotrophus TaxID=1769250 RepID=A0A840LBR0_9BURK|nr:PEP-CTERM sorting domain-containing protein [Roseateles oligotrophus]MBB4844305.1 putative membrane protein [Roseateles oligotrophus]
MKTAAFFRHAALAGAASLCLAGTGWAQQLDVFNSPGVGYGVSADGRYAVFGSAGPGGGTHAYLWSAATHTLTDIGGFAGTAGALEISRDGRYVAGQIQDAQGKFQAAVYSRDTGAWSQVPALGGLNSAGTTGSVVWAMSGDGRYVGGSSYVPGSTVSRGFVTDRLSGTVVSLGSTEARVEAMNLDASVLVGYTTNSRRAAVWTRNASGEYDMTTPGRPESPTLGLYQLSAMSSNGSWAAGTSFNNALPYRYDVATGQVLYYDKLPFLSPTGRGTASTSAISDDGLTMVGIHSPQGALLSGSYAFIWRGDGTVNGNQLGGSVQTLDDYLAGYGIDTANHYDFKSVVGMSADGHTFTGIAADNLTGNQVSFVVSIPSAVPEPGQYLLLLGGLAALLLRRRSLV